MGLTDSLFNLKSFTGSSEIAEEIRPEVERLEEVINKAKERLKAVDDVIHNHIMSVNSVQLQAFAVARRITIALEVRFAEIRETFACGGRASITRASDLLKEDLIIANDKLNSVVGEEDIRPIKISESEELIDQLLTMVEDHLDSVAAA